jgi:hypothetical protein
MPAGAIAAATRAVTEIVASDSVHASCCSPTQIDLPRGTDSGTAFSFVAGLVGGEPAFDFDAAVAVLAAAGTNVNENSPHCVTAHNNNDANNHKCRIYVCSLQEQCLAAEDGDDDEDDDGDDDGPPPLDDV